MRRLVFCVLLAMSLGLLVGCGSSEEQAAQAPCDLDIKNLDSLHGSWISLTGGGEGSDVPDKYARVRFSNEGGKQQGIFTAGRLTPGNPATNKYTYEFANHDNLGDAVYSINLFPGKSRQRIDRLKKDNRRLDVKFEGRMYVKVDSVNCALVISDMYVTYVRGDEKMDSNPTGTRTYLRLGPNEAPLSWVHCEEARQLVPFAVEKVNWEKDRPLDAKKGIFAGEPLWFQYAHKLYQGRDARQKWVKDGVYPEDGASYDYELWVRDNPVEGAQKIAVQPDPEDDNRIAWRHQHTFQKSSSVGVFVEMHRYKTKDGKRELAGNACTVVWPENARTEEEKKAAEAEAKKKR